MKGQISRTALPILIAATVAIIVAGAGALSTTLGPWYFALNMPSWKPPDWLFGPAWTLIFACAAISAASGWVEAETVTRRRLVLALFIANALLESLWSVLFFRLERPDWALEEVGFLWLSILALIVILAPRSPRAAWLLAPYIVWVSFAALLNWAVVDLNGPFDGL